MPSVSVVVAADRRRSAPTPWSSGVRSTNGRPASCAAGPRPSTTALGGRLARRAARARRDRPARRGRQDPDARAGRLPARRRHRPRRRPDRRRGRRAARPAPRVRALPASAARARRASTRPAGALAEGALLGAYAFTDYKSAAGQARAAHGHHRRGDAAARAEVRRAAIVADAVDRSSATWSTPRPTTSIPQTFADRAARAGRASTDSTVEVLDERALRAASTAASSASGRAAPARRGWCGSPTARRRATRARRPGRQGHHLRLRRAEPQDREPDLDEVRHGRRGRGDRRGARRRRAEAAGGGHGHRADGREHAVRHVLPALGRPAHVRRHAPSRSPTPTPRAGSSWPTRSPARSRTSRTT